MRYPVFLILHNIRSVHNVGAIFRTAECAGVSKVYLTGYTPTPLDRFGRPRADFHKAALGAEELVPWEHNESCSYVLNALKTQKVRIIALEQSLKAIDYKTVRVAGPLAVILGNEVDGLPEDILKEADAITEIPLRGKKESLNVSVAAGIALFRFLEI